jgi:isochorismate pyruvate lyase
MVGWPDADQGDAMTQDGIDQIRTEIDQLDRRIVALLAEREQFVRRAGRVKTSADGVRAPKRVEEVVERVRALAVELGAAPEVVERTYRAMIAAFVDLELTAFASAEGGSGSPQGHPHTP